MLDIMRKEADAREVRVDVLRATLEKAENKDWEDLIGFETKLPPLPKRPVTKRARRVPIVPRPTTSGAKKRKRSCSRPLVSVDKVRLLAGRILQKGPAV